MNVLLTGAGGQLGRCIQDRCPAQWTLHALTSTELDIADRQAVDAQVSRVKPDLIVNAAAYNAVDEAETQVELAHAVNALGPRHLARAARCAGARLVHISSDYVFDGRRNTPYREDDEANSVNVYGQSKRAGELAVLGADPQAVIIRTSWLFSEYGNNFVKTILRLAGSGKPLSVVDDQIGCPTYAGSLAQAIIDLMRSALSGANHGGLQGGLYHYCGPTAMSWHAFASQILQCADGMDGGHRLRLLHAVATRQRPTRAARPAYSALSCLKVHAVRHDVAHPDDDGLFQVVATCLRNDSTI